MKPPTFLVKYWFYANTLWSLISNENASFLNIFLSAHRTMQRAKIPRFCISKSLMIKIFEEKWFEMGTEEGRGTEKEEEHEMKQKHDN